MKLFAKSAADYLGMKEGIKGYGQWERGSPYSLHIPFKLNPIAFICYTWQKARKLYWCLKQVFTQAGWKNETCLNKAQYSYPGRKKWEIKTRCMYLTYIFIFRAYLRFLSPGTAKSAQQKCEMCEHTCWTEGKVSDLEKCSSSHSLAKKSN